MSFNPCFFASALVSVQTVQQSLYCLLPFFYVIFQPHTFSDSLKFWTTTHPYPLLSISLALLCLHSQEAASHLHTRPHHLLCSCDTTICHGIRLFCLLLCFFRFWVWIPFFFFFCLAVSYFEVLSFHHFFSASSVCPSLLINFFPACPVCLSIQPSTCSQSSLHTHSHSLCWPSFPPLINYLI